MRARGHRNRGIGDMRPEDNLREDHGRIMKLFAAWQKMLGDDKIHVLTAYVYSLSQK